MNENKNIKIPNHVAIILDGNGRWAKERGKKRTEGHKEGFKRLKSISKYILNTGTKYLSVFAFSTENFKRPKEEVDFLMNLFIEGFKKDSKYFVKENIKVVFSGRKENLRKDVLDAMDKLEELTQNNTLGTLNICLNYGGRAEIVDAVNKIINNNHKEINEDILSSYMYNELPDIDLMIRTSGEVRISNFMLWQLSYAELYFPKCYFPDFDEEEYQKALLEYNNRSRRFGSLNNE